MATKLTFQTNDVLVEIFVNNPKDVWEVYNTVKNEYGNAVAFECVELYMNSDYLED